jgi:Uma2 family endonuclease
MARVAQHTGLSPAAFLAWERQQPARHEYFRGEVFAMAGGSVRHNALCARVIGGLQGALPASCNVLTSDQRVGVSGGERYVYPDVSVVCGAVVLEPGTADVLSNPTVLVEVLSASTEQYDRGLTWEGYQRLPSLTDFLLVAQAEPRIEHFRRGEGGAWLYRSAVSGERVTLANGVALEVDAVFAGTLELPGD